MVVLKLACLDACPLLRKVSKEVAVKILLADLGAFSKVVGENGAECEAFLAGAGFEAAQILKINVYNEI